LSISRLELNTADFWQIFDMRDCRLVVGNGLAYARGFVSLVLGARVAPFASECPHVPVTCVHYAGPQTPPKSAPGPQSPPLRPRK